MPVSPRLARYFHPKLENLEVRAVPAANYWIANGWQGNTFWHNAANWSLGTVPTVNDDVILNSTHSNLSCDYIGPGGAIARSVALKDGYSGSLNLVSGTVQLNGLTMESEAGSINQVLSSARIEVMDWVFQAGLLNTATPTSSEVMVHGSFTAAPGYVTRGLGSSVVFGVGCVSTINLIDGNIELRKSNIVLDNHGLMQQESGVISAVWHTGEDFQTSEATQIRNYGTWKKLTGATAKVQSVAFLNAGGGVVRIESGKLELSDGSSAQDGCYVQTGGTTRIYAGATLEALIFEPDPGTYEIDIRSGLVETVGAGTANMDAHRVRFLNCLVKLRADDPIGFGTLANSKIDNEIEFAGTAHLIVKVHNGGNCDAIIGSTVRLDGDQLKLTVREVGPDPLPVGATWTFLVADTVAGAWGIEDFPAGVDLLTPGILIKSE